MTILVEARDAAESDADLTRNVLFVWPKIVVKPLHTQGNSPNETWCAMHSGRIPQVAGKPDIAAKFHVNDQTHLTKCVINDKHKNEILTVRLSAPAVTASGNAPVVSPATWLTNPEQQASSQADAGKLVVSALPSGGVSAAAPSLKRPLSPPETAENSFLAKQRLETDSGATGSGIPDLDMNFDLDEDLEKFDSDAVFATLIHGFDSITMPANRETLLNYYSPVASAIAAPPDSSRLSGPVGFVMHLETSEMDVDAFMQLEPTARNKLARNYLNTLPSGARNFERQIASEELGPFLQKLHEKSGDRYLQEERTDALWAARIPGWGEMTKVVHRNKIIDEFREYTMTGLSEKWAREKISVLGTFLTRVEFNSGIRILKTFLVFDETKRETVLTEMHLGHKENERVRTFISRQLGIARDAPNRPSNRENKAALEQTIKWMERFQEGKYGWYRRAQIEAQVAKWMYYIEQQPEHAHIAAKELALKSDDEWKSSKLSYLPHVMKSQCALANGSLEVFRTSSHLDAWQATYSSDPALGKQALNCVNSWIQWRIDTLPKQAKPRRVVEYMRQFSEAKCLKQVATYLGQSHASVGEAERAVHTDSVIDFRNWVRNVAGQPTASTSTAVIASGQ